MTYCKHCGADLPPNKKIRDNKQIKIEELIPFMRKGWVACDKDGVWWYYHYLPEIQQSFWSSTGVEEEFCLSDIIQIAPAEDWTKSLIKIERK